MARQDLRDGPMDPTFIYLEHNPIADRELPAFSALLLESPSQ
jgi:hypothetical protein